MKRYLLLAFGLIAIVASSVTPSSPARAWGSIGCSNAGVAGQWGYTYTGTLILPTGGVPVASVGRFTQDAAGNVNGTQSRSVGGGQALEVITGKITVNADCSASGPFKVYQGGVFQRSADINFVYDNNANHIRGIFRDLVLSNGTSVPLVVTIDGNRMFHYGDR